MVSWDLAKYDSFHHAYWAIAVANCCCGIPLLRYASPLPSASADGASQPARPLPQAIRDPSDRRRMFTGQSSEDVPGGQWQLWILWYSFFFWCTRAIQPPLPL